MAKLLLNLYTPQQKSGGLSGLQEQRSRDVSITFGILVFVSTVQLNRIISCRQFSSTMLELFVALV